MSGQTLIPPLTAWLVGARVIKIYRNSLKASVSRNSSAITNMVAGGQSFQENTFSGHSPMNLYSALTLIAKSDRSVLVSLGHDRCPVFIAIVAMGNESDA